MSMPSGGLRTCRSRNALNSVIPAKAGIQKEHATPQPPHWIPAFAGMTRGRKRLLQAQGAVSEKPPLLASASFRRFLELEDALDRDAEDAGNSVG